MATSSSSYSLFDLWSSAIVTTVYKHNQNAWTIDMHDPTTIKTNEYLYKESLLNR